MGWNRGRGDLKYLDKGLPFYTSPQHQSGSGPFHGARKCGGGNKPPLNSQQRTAAPLPHTALDREQMFFLRASLFRQQEVFFLSFHKGYSKCYRINVANAACASALDTDASPPLPESIFCLFSRTPAPPSLPGLNSRGQANTSHQNLVASDRGSQFLRSMTNQPQESHKSFKALWPPGENSGFCLLWESFGWRWF